MNACRVSLHAGGQVLKVTVVPVLVADLVVEEVHVRGTRGLLDELCDLRIVPWKESDTFLVQISMNSEGVNIVRLCPFNWSELESVIDRSMLRPVLRPYYSAEASAEAASVKFSKIRQIQKLR